MVAMTIFNDNDDVFSTLGEEQFLKTGISQTMDIAKVGFAISSSTLRLAKSSRKIIFKIRPSYIHRISFTIYYFCIRKNISVSYTHLTLPTKA